MYKKFLIVASKKDKAGINITTQLSQIGKYKFHLIEEDTIYTKNLDLEKINSYDFIIFVSKHESQKKEKSLCVHVPGNWRSANFGGESGKVCKSSALFFKQIFEKLNENAKNHTVKDYNITMEVTHHGPLIEKPCIFVELGSSENEWADRKAGFVVAKTVSETIENFRENPYNEIAIAIGGPHYCPSFNQIQKNSNVAISHVIPIYAAPITEEMVREAIEKTEEEVDFILLDWKGLGKSEHKKELLDFLKNFYLQYRKTGEIDK